MILALLMLCVELADYGHWSKEAYHRRLTMTMHRVQDPPLYPVPGALHFVTQWRVETVCTWVDDGGVSVFLGACGNCLYMG